MTISLDTAVMPWQPVTKFARIDWKSDVPTRDQIPDCAFSFLSFKAPEQIFRSGRKDEHPPAIKGTP